MKAASSTAATISVRETLDLLDGAFYGLAAGVAEDRYAFWIGSGVSLGRVDGLRQLVPRIVEFLRARSISASDHARFSNALESVLQLADLTSTERAALDLNRPFAEWPNAATIVTRLSGNYSKLLDITVAGEEDDFLLWQAADVATTFADQTIEPDVEHICIACLINEGVASVLLSANWDGLIERAERDASRGDGRLVVTVRAEDLRLPDRASRLYKFHGCAVLAANDPSTFRQYLIARQSQISAWMTAVPTQAVALRMIDIAKTRPTLMIGLSAQDANIQSVFATASATMAWPFPGERPAYVFAEDKLGTNQEALLKNVYHHSYSAATRDDIFASARLRAYAKPLLAALLIHVISQKMQRFIEFAAGKFSGEDRALLCRGVLTLRNAVASVLSVDQPQALRAAITEATRVLRLYRLGTAGPSADGEYVPLAEGALQQIATAYPLDHQGSSELCVAVGILGLGQANGLWTVRPANTDDSQTHSLGVVGKRGVTRILLVANSHVALTFFAGALQHLGADTVVVHGRRLPRPVRRSPRAAPGRTGVATRREFSIEELIEAASDVDDLLRRFSELSVL